MILISMTAVPIFHRTGVYRHTITGAEVRRQNQSAGSIVFLLRADWLAASLCTLRQWYSPSFWVGPIIIRPGSWASRARIHRLPGNSAVTWTIFNRCSSCSPAVGKLVWQSGFCPPTCFGDATFPSRRGWADESRRNSFFERSVQHWSGLIGGMFLSLVTLNRSSQVQRYLTGKSIAQSRLACCSTRSQIPMQFLICSLAPWYSCSTH